MCTFNCPSSSPDPLKAVRRLAGRPLLMTHGRHDRTVRPTDADRLFAAAGMEPTLRALIRTYGAMNVQR